MVPKPLKVRRDKPVPTRVSDWSRVSEVQVFTPIDSIELRILATDALNHGKSIRAMSPECEYAASRAAS